VTAAGKNGLHTKGAVLKELPMGWRLEALKALSDPNIAFLLMTVGTIGLLAELYNPGAILPGVVGAISLILAFYSLQTLPINYAGVLLIIVGIVLFILEIKVVSYGLLSLGGLASLILGALMLVKTDAPFMKVSLEFVVPFAMMVGAMLMTLTWMAVRTQRRAAVTGIEAMVGSIGVAKTDVAPRGRVFVQGEIWDAMSDEPIREGEEAQIKAVSGLTLKVAPHRKSISRGAQ
jgi:membrane-bound serine protease (ClpP class)